MNYNFSSSSAPGSTPTLSFDFDNPIYAWAGVALICTFLMYGTLLKDPYCAIPAVGGRGFLSSYVGAIRYVKHGKDMVQLGYDKLHGSGVFRIPLLNRWNIVVSGEKLVEDLRRAPEDTLSSAVAIKELFLAEFLLGNSDTYPTHLVQKQLTQNLDPLFPELREEMLLAFQDNIPETDGWTKVPAYKKVLEIATRTSNRIFVGAPLCRDPEYIALSIRYTIDVGEAWCMLFLVPNFLKPLAGRLLTEVPKSLKLGMRLLGPLIEERQQKLDEFGADYPNKPNDFLSWLMDEAGEERTLKSITQRMLTLSLAAVHSNSMTLTNALFELALRPEYIDPIRKEVEIIIAEEGWTKVAMTGMHKLDSFLKESLRMNGAAAVTMTRKALKDFTFSDGTHIPKGTFVSAAARPRHFDDEVYANSRTFDGFRFSEIRDKYRQATTNQFSSTNPNYLPFGHGKHACPGRFFASNVLKAMLAHIVLTYDIKMENGGMRPETRWFGVNGLPDTTANVLFRRRQT